MNIYFIIFLGSWEIKILVLVNLKMVFFLIQIRLLECRISNSSCRSPFNGFGRCRRCTIFFPSPNSLPMGLGGRRLFGSEVEYLL